MSHKSPLARWTLLLAGIVLICLSARIVQKWITVPEPQSLGHAEDFRLIDCDGNGFELYSNKTARAIVIIAHTVGCPILRQSGPDILELRNRYKSQGVEFYMINAQDSRDEILKESSEFHLDVPVLLDSSQIVSRDLDLEHSVETVLIDPRTWTIVYRGAINDRVDYTGERNTAAHAWLRDAIDALLAGRPIATNRTDANGCVINYNQLEPISYKRQIVPVLRRACLGCHQAGDLGPDLTTFKRLKKWAPTIRETLVTLRMPPWPFDPAFGHFQPRLILSAAQRSLLVTWIDHGMPKGHAPDSLMKNFHYNDEKPARSPDLEWTMKENIQVPATGKVPYAHFQIAGPFDHDVYLSALEVSGYNKTVLHHVMLLACKRPLKAYGNIFRTVNALDYLFDTHEGDPLFMASRESRGDLRAFHRGFAWKIPRGDYIILQMHMRTTGRAETTGAHVALWYYRDTRPPTELKRLVLHNDPIETSSGGAPVVESVSVTLTHAIVAFDLTLHLHRRGLSVRMTAQYPDGKSEILASEPFYTFNQINTASFDKPKFFPAGTKIELRGVYRDPKSDPDDPEAEFRESATQFANKKQIGYFTYYDAHQPVGLDRDQ